MNSVPQCLHVARQLVCHMTVTYLDQAEEILAGQISGLMGV
ncbi:hypothetical protein EG68_03689 [Paragonimus skrjabini miyazakii]|uniref:Uncharacterized protein n=1 Tax=Paragonimus skrjabini miyazakii TaxID=59628 RepID=A0A8S9Z105_9TREM|nr:hypothetical protein EG68_03689 [Paragonimus skrjabini miyazakii]